MFRSFLNIFLPDDEYKRTRILYFMAEAMLMTVVAFLVIGMPVYFFNHLSIDGEALLFLTPFLMVTYTFLRYIFSGLQHTEIFHERDYKRERLQAIIRTGLSGFFFFIALLIIKGIPKNISETLDLIFLPVFFIIFYFILEITSLKRSIKKNKELDE